MRITVMFNFLMVFLIFTGSLTHAVDDFPYLEPLEEDKGQKYVIGIPPMNNTGDYSHLLAFLLLAQSHKKEAPPIVYGYDGKKVLQTAESKLNTYSQVVRAKDFFAQLGFGKQLEVIKGKELRLYRDTVRRKAFREALAEKGYTHLIDQKLLTTCVVNHCAVHGRETTTDMIRGQLIGRLIDEVNLEASLFEKLESQVSNDMAAIKTFVSIGKPLVIIHARYSAKAKQQQNFDPDVLNQLRYYLTQSGYLVWHIITDGRTTQTSFKGVKNRTDVFPFVVEGKDHGKLRHLALLLELYQQRDSLNLKGFIGNTSGTLDMASFIGHRVYNIHQFSIEDPNFADDMRLTLQSALMTIEDINYEKLYTSMKDADGKIAPFTDDTAAEAFPSLIKWLNGNPLVSASRELTSVADYSVKLGELFCVQQLTPDGKIINRLMPGSPTAMKHVRNKREKELKSVRRNLSFDFAAVLK